MPSDNYLESNPVPLTQKKQDTLLVSEMLTPSEIEQLRQSAEDANAFFQKEFTSRGTPNTV